MVSSSVSNSQIEYIDAPHREYFELNYVKRNKPVILTGVSNEWPAISKWTPNYLKSVGGKSIVDVRFVKNGEFQPTITPNRKMPFGEFIDLLLTESSDGRFSMEAKPLRHISSRLLDDIDISAYVKQPKPTVFLGRDTFTPLHYHTIANSLLCQLHGTKTVKLFSPAQFKYLYPHPWHAANHRMSRVDPRQPDLDRFPKFKRAKPLEAILHPGEILFIPVHWWHVTSCSGLQISVSFFVKHSLNSWGFPMPRLRIYIRDLLFRAKIKLGHTNNL